MKKRFVLSALMALMLIFLSSCSSAETIDYVKTNLVIDAAEILTYSITYNGDSATNGKVKFALDEAASFYRTELTVDADGIYTFETETKICGVYTIDGSETIVNDRMTTKTSFRYSGDGLKAIKSEKTSKTTGILGNNSLEVDEFSYVIDYSEEKPKSTITMDGKDTIISYDKPESGFIDNNILYLGIRCFFYLDSKASFNLKTFDGFSQGYMPLLLKPNSPANITLTFDGKPDQEAVDLSLSLNQTMSGPLFRLCFTKKYEQRKLLLLEQYLPYGTGILIYKLK